MVVLLNFGKSANWWRIFVYCSINECFLCKLKLSTLLRLESLISFLEDINDQRSNFVEKDDLSVYKVFL